MTTTRTRRIVTTVVLAATAGFGLAACSTGTPGTAAPGVDSVVSSSQTVSAAVPTDPAQPAQDRNVTPKPTQATSAAATPAEIAYAHQLNEVVGHYADTMDAYASGQYALASRRLDAMDAELTTLTALPKGGRVAAAAAPLLMNMHSGMTVIAGGGRVPSYLPDDFGTAYGSFLSKAQDLGIYLGSPTGSSGR